MTISYLLRSLLKRAKPVCVSCLLLLRNLFKPHRPEEFIRSPLEYVPYLPVNSIRFPPLAHGLCFGALTPSVVTVRFLTRTTMRIFSWSHSPRVFFFTLPMAPVNALPFHYDRTLNSSTKIFIKVEQALSHYVRSYQERADCHRR